MASSFGSARELDACGIGFVAHAHGTASRSIVDSALGGLASVIHRGAIAADSRSADGAGVLLPIPRNLFPSDAGIAMLFVRGDDPRDELAAAAAAEGLEIIDWRTPPVDDDALGQIARDGRPQLRQVVFATKGGAEGDERVALRLRRRLATLSGRVYVASCSFRTTVYKGLSAANRVADFWLDLQDPAIEVPFVIFHQRFSTNTLPTWERAQPFRTLCHNGEINAIRGNENRMVARAVLGTETAGLGDEDLYRPLLDPQASDSGKLDEAVEFLTRGGRDIRHVMAMLVPQPWENDRDLDPEVRGFYRYHAALMEPWDGPAGLVFTDGIGVGATLDRNGLRPMRYEICEDGLVVCCSEAGAVDLSGHGQVKRGRIGPGEMLFIDPTRGVLHDAALKERLAAAAPYGKWATDGLLSMSRGNPVEGVPDDLERRQIVHGFSKEELAMIIKPMFTDGKEPTFSMGDDSPLPLLAGRARPLPHYLKQRFAQVTNPPIDHLRERRVMSLRTLLGPRKPILSERPEAARLLTFKSFFLYPSAVDALLNPFDNPLAADRIDISFAADDGPDGLLAAVDAACDRAERLVRGGTGVLVIGPGELASGVPVPSLLATGAVHHRLVAERLRSLVSLVVVTDDLRDTHGAATLLGYGADAICPRLALQSVAEESDRTDGDPVSTEAQSRFQAAIEDGVLKIMSKMGISTVDSYRGAQIFEVNGLAPDVVERCFPGTPNIIGGIGWDALGEDALARWEAPDLGDGGWVRVRRAGEYHAHSKEVVDSLNALTLVKDHLDDPADHDMAAAHLLQRAIKGDRYDLYEQFAELVANRPPTEVHDLLELIAAPSPIPLDEVEPAATIVKRFSTGAMSHGALSREAHETLTRAMNLLGALSNCGEGGEAPDRYRTRGQGRDDRNSRIKQIASGRFGVTPEYVAHADELNIKMAQGSKPGEGGQLPGHKVTAEIARLRHTQPGVALISPPPHHDIYSIEDLAQLIYDLKQVNAAQVSVKLVAEDGVGTVAAGVVKALADVVQISGANGGTGASPLSSIKHAGMPWELGLADTQQALVSDGLRSRVRIRVDGGFKTGRQVIMAALLGADEYSFGTAAMIAEGCIMLRACHRDTCKPGVATQRENLRANFSGTPEGVAAYFLYVAEDVRTHLAALGLRTLDEAIGRTDLLRQRTTGDRRADSLDLSPLLTRASDDVPLRFVEGVAMQMPRSDLGDRLLADAFRPLWEGEDIDVRYPITNGDRTIGAALGGAVALEFGSTRPRGTVRATFDGAAGQSFGAFITHGIELELVGPANDYVGKGMGGGSIIIRPPEDDAGDPALAGNTCLYGATGGELYVAGSVGERFAVRNSGAVSVVEGTGDHCCEYMTGGLVVVLGPVGHNLGAGMTGGQAFVWDPRNRLGTRLNSALVEALRPGQDDLDGLKWMVERHADLAGSTRAHELLKHWDRASEEFWMVLPSDRIKRIEAGAAGRVAASA